MNVLTNGDIFMLKELSRGKRLKDIWSEGRDRGQQMRRIKRILGAKTMIEAVAIAIRKGFI